MSEYQDDRPVADLPNLGHGSRAMLATVGIVTVGDLRRIGAVAAYAKAKAANKGASLNLLWALEGALSGALWTLVARQRRTELLLKLDDYLSHQKPTC